METNQPDIDTMYRVKCILDSNSAEVQNKSYKTILSLVNRYLEEYCIHKIIVDDIDNHLDYSTRIQYCEKCFKTFT